MDAKNGKQFTTVEQRLEQLEQAKRTTPNDIEEDTESSTRVAIRFPPDTSEAPITKFLQYAMQQESLTGQLTQIRGTTDPTTHAFLTFNPKPERKHFVKVLRPSQDVGRRSTRLRQFHEDISW